MKQTYLYAFDTETSVYAHQKTTEIWSVAICPIRTKLLMDKGIPKPERKDCINFHRLQDFINWCDNSSLNRLVFYVHNLKYDATFLCDWIMKHGYTWHEKQDKKEKPIPLTFNALIGDMSQWYSFTVITESGVVCEFRDSLKLINSSLKSAAESFNTEHKKLEMEYKGERHEGCYISPNELAYIQNDVLVLSELMECLIELGFGQTSKKSTNNELPLTDASAAKKEYLDIMPTMYCKENYPDISALKEDLFNRIQYSEIGAKNGDDYVRKSYRGGWCYAKTDRTEIEYNTRNCVSYKVAGKVASGEYIGLTADVNSLYPSMMHSESGNYYPVGFPHIVLGKDILNFKLPKYYTFIRLKCRFHLRRGYLPFMQIKGNPYYNGNVMLEDSIPTVLGKRTKRAVLKGGGEITDMVELTLTCVDYELFHKHYIVEDEEILDGVYFYTDKGMFDAYINKWMEVKKNSKGAKRQVAKIMLNSLYGRFAISPDNKVRIPHIENGILVLKVETRPDKKPWYIPIGSAITSYARRFTITAAQKNYKYFCYADTDSIHCLCSREKIKGIKVHPKNLCCWKLESFWDKAIFVRAKTYIEHVCAEDEEAIEKPYNNIKCAGMPDSSKKLLDKSFTESEYERAHNERLFKLTGEIDDYDTIQKTYKFLSVKRNYKDFTAGLEVPGKLMPVHIPGGIILTDTDFTMRNK